MLPAIPTSPMLIAVALLASGACGHLGHLVSGAASGLGHAAEATGKAVATAASTTGKAVASAASTAGKAASGAAKAGKSAGGAASSAGKSAGAAAANAGKASSGAASTVGAAVSAGHAGIGKAAASGTGATPIARPVQPGSTPIAGPVRPHPPKPPRPPSTPAPTIAYVEPGWGGRYGDGSAFFWSAGAVYRPDHLGDETGGPARSVPASVALLGVSPAGGGDLRSARSALLEMVAEAQTLIDLSAPGLGSASTVEPLLWALQEAAERGARVRVLLDEKAAPAAVSALRGRRGIELRQASGELRAALGAAYLVIDRGEACLASEALRGDSRGPELALLLRAPASVIALEDVFESDWALAAASSGPAQQPPAGGYRLPEPAQASPELAQGASAKLSLQPVFTPRGRLPAEALWEQPALVSLIDSARQSLALRFVSDDDLDAQLADALGRASRRGVRIQLLIPGGPAPEARSLRVLARGAGVEEKTGAPAAAALAFIAADGKRAFLGSGGLSTASLSVERNAGMVIEGPAVAAALERFFRAAWAEASGPLALR